MVIGAILYGDKPEALDALQSGSMLEVIGIVQLEYAPISQIRQSFRPVRLDVLLRSAQAAEPLERMKLVVAWFLSGFHYKTVVRGAGRAPSHKPRPPAHAAPTHAPRMFSSSIVRSP